MKYDVRIDGETKYKFDTLAEANAQAEKLNGTLSLTAPDKKAIVVGEQCVKKSMSYIVKPLYMTCFF